MSAPIVSPHNDSTETHKSRTAPRVFRGWYIVAVAHLANFMSVGTGFYLMNAFMQPLCAAHGWSRTDLNLALVFGSMFGYLSQLLYGTLVMRTGPRILMAAGPLVAGISFAFMIRAGSLPQFYLFYILLYAGNGAYGGIVANTAVNNWFIVKRGRAMGIATAGISLSGAVLPLLAQALILHQGLNNSALWIGIAVLMVAPVAWLIIRDWPEDYGLSPDGIQPPLSTPRKPGDKSPIASTGRLESTWNLARLIGSGTFWKLGVSVALVLTSAVGVMSQLKPRFSDLGFDDMTAMGMMAATALLGAGGKYFWGMMSDRMESRRIFAALAVANSLGLAFAFVDGSIGPLVLFILLFGFSMGGVMSIYPIMVADLFGRRAFPAVFRFTSLFLMLQGVGFLVAGQSFDRTGSYDSAYAVFIVFDLIAAVLILTARQPEPIGQTG